MQPLYSLLVLVSGVLCISSVTVLILSPNRHLRRRIRSLPSQTGQDTLAALLSRSSTSDAPAAVAEVKRKVFNTAPRTVTVRKLMQESGLLWSSEGVILRLVMMAVLASAPFLWFGLAPTLALTLGAVLGPFLLFLYVKRRQIQRLRAFEAEFATALDSIIRGLRSGLPLTQCLAIAAASAKEPGQSEFRRVVEAHSLGRPLPAALEDLAERIPLTEVRLFALMIGVQQQTGGSLSEALSNLAETLRGRWELARKVRTSSQEARASAMIVGSLPFLVTVVLYLASPDYLLPMVQTGPGLTVLVAGILWMLIGVYVMWRMVNFDV
jgi:tight adherence protein B